MQLTIDIKQDNSWRQHASLLFYIALHSLWNIWQCTFALIVDFITYIWRERRSYHPCKKNCVSRQLDVLSMAVEGGITRKVCGHVYAQLHLVRLIIILVLQSKAEKIVFVHFFFFWILVGIKWWILINIWLYVRNYLNFLLNLEFSMIFT